MARRLRSVGLDFVENAPVRLVFSREFPAAPEAVFCVLAEDVPGRAEWYAAVQWARPLDDGARREVRLKGGTRFEETVLAAKEAELYAYRADAPGERALAEEWRLPPAAHTCSGPSRPTGRCRCASPSRRPAQDWAGPSATR
jgi:hypothetical protein